MNNVDFLAKTGRLPENDDLHRCNCNQVGTIGHQQCGICTKCELPRFICGCVAILTLIEKHPNATAIPTTKVWTEEDAKIAEEDAQEARCYADANTD